MKNWVKGILILAAHFLFSAFCGAALMSMDNCPHFYHVLGAIQVTFCLMVLGAMVILFALKYGEEE